MRFTISCTSGKPLTDLPDVAEHTETIAGHVFRYTTMEIADLAELLALVEKVGGVIVSPGAEQATDGWCAMPSLEVYDDYRE